MGMWVKGVNLNSMEWNGNALTADDKFDASGRDVDNYIIRNWLGVLSGGASTNIIYTDMYGHVQIKITLDQAGNFRIEFIGIILVRITIN
jgi:hypothetical protein